MSARIRITRVGAQNRTACIGATTPLAQCELYRGAELALCITATIQSDGQGYVFGVMRAAPGVVLDIPHARAVLAQLLHPLDWSRRDLRDRQYTVRALPEGRAAIATPTGTLDLHYDAEARN